MVSMKNSGNKIIRVLILGLWTQLLKSNNNSTNNAMQMEFKLTTEYKEFFLRVVNPIGKNFNTDNTLFGIF